MPYRLAIPQELDVRQIVVKKIGEPTGIRTPDTRLRRPLLYPTELWTHIAQLNLIQNNGADGGNRTPNLLITNQLLYR